MLKADGYDDCIIGRSAIWLVNERVDVIVYSADLVIKELMNKDGMSYDEAVEFFCFNIDGAYVGKHTPVFVWECDLE